MRNGFAFVVLAAGLGLAPAAPVPSRLDADRKALRATDPDLRRTAALRLGWLGGDAAPAVPDLVRALRDPDSVVAHDAANALVRIGPPAAEALGKALRDEAPEVRWRAWVALFRMGPDAKAAVPALADRVRTAKSHQLRINAALILGRMGPDAKVALPALRAAASDRSAELASHRSRPSSVCEAAIIATRAVDPDALKELARAALPTLRDMLLAPGGDLEVLAGRHAAFRALALLGPHAAPALTDLRIARAEYRLNAGQFARACIALGKGGREHLLELICDPTEDAVLRRSLLEALPALPEPADEIRVLVRLLADKDDAICCLAALALAAQGPAAEPAIPTLVKALADPVFNHNPEVPRREYFASEALARIGPKAVPALRAALKDKKTRDRAIIALGRMESGARAAAPDLRELLAGPPTATSVSAAVALLRIGEAPTEPVRVLVAALDTNLQGQALAHLAYNCAEDVFWPLAGDARRSALAVPREAIPVLLRLLNGPDRYTAATVLGGTPGAADVIVPEIRTRLCAIREEHRPALLSVCEALGPAAKDAVPDILGCLRQDRSAGTQQAAFRALGAIGPAAKEAIPVLTRAAADRQHPATREAVLALVGLGLEAPEVIDTLVRVLQDSADGRPGRRDRQSSAAAALMRLGPAAKRALPALREAQLSDDALVRVYATAALLRAGDDDTPVGRLLSAWRDSYDPAEMYSLVPHWLEAIELLGPRAAGAVPQLIALLADPADEYDEDFRAGAARALGTIGSEARTALPRLRELVAGRGAAARAAARAIRTIAGD
jgi:HEAT repeat protein